MSDTPRIYVACLASYNGGELHGEWIDLEEWSTIEGVESVISDMLKASNFPNVERRDWTCDSCGEKWRNDAATLALPCRSCGANSSDVTGSEPFSSAEEHAIHDHEGFGEWGPGENESLAMVCQMAESIGAHGLAFPAWVEHVGADFDDVAGFEEAYAGEWDNEKVFGEELADETIPGLSDDSAPLLSNYFDYDAWTRDLFLGDYFSETNPEGGVWVFRST